MKIPNLIRVGLIFLVMGAIFFVVVPARAATVTMRVPAVQGQAGSTADVPVEVAGASGLGAIHIELVYDPKVLAVDSVSKGTLAGSNALFDFNPGTPGRLLIGMATLDAIKGDGPVATVRFKVTGNAGMSSPLTLENSKAWDAETHAEVLVKTEAGQLTIVGGLPIWLIALLVAAVAMLVLFLLFFLFMRRRRQRPQPAVAQPVYSRPVATPPPPPMPIAGGPPPPMGIPESKVAVPNGSAGNFFKTVEDQYFTLRGRLSAGRMTQADFEAELKKLMTQDPQGRYWMMGADTGKWYVYDGNTWVEGQPY